MKLKWVSIPTTAVPELIKTLKDEDWANSHQGVVEALKQIGTPEAMKAVEEWEKNKNG